MAVGYGRPTILMGGAKACIGWGRSRGPYNSMVLKGRDPVETPPLEEYVDIDPDDRDADAGVTPPVAEPGASAAWEPRKRISSS